MIQMRNEGGLAQRGRDGGGKKESALDIFWRQMIGFAGGFAMKRGRKRSSNSFWPEPSVMGNGIWEPSFGHVKFDMLIRYQKGGVE